MEDKKKVRADFNGLFGDVLCLSHKDTCIEESGTVLQLEEGLLLTAYDEDLDENGKRDDLLATGSVEASPEWLKCTGSKWVLRIDEGGVRNESELRSSSHAQQALAADSVERGGS